LTNISFTEHVTVNGGRVQISGVTGSGGQADVQIYAYDADDGVLAPLPTDAGDYDNDPEDTLDTIFGNDIVILAADGVTEVTINEVIGEGDPAADSTAVYIREMDDGSVIIYNMEDDWTVTHVNTLDGFNRLEVENADTSGNDFRITEVGFGTSDSGDPIDLSLDVTVTDQDGDSSSGTIDVTLLPEITGDGTLLGNGSDEFLVGGTGADDLIGDGGSDILVGNGGADTFVWVSGADVDDDGTGTLDGSVSAVDTIIDFRASEGDTLDISALLSDIGDAGNGNGSVQVVLGADDTVAVQVDLTGTGVGTFETFVVVENVDGILQSQLETDVQNALVVT